MPSRSTTHLSVSVHAVKGDPGDAYSPLVVELIKRTQPQSHSRASSTPGEAHTVLLTHYSRPFDPAALAPLSCAPRPCSSRGKPYDEDERGEREDDQQSLGSWSAHVGSRRSWEDRGSPPQCPCERSVRRGGDATGCGVHLVRFDSGQLWRGRGLCSSGSGVRAELRREGGELHGRWKTRAGCCVF